MKKARLGFKVKVGAIILVSVVFIVIVSQNIEAVAQRWTRTVAEGDTSGREEIYARSLEMFRDRPMLGWGLYHQNELGARLGRETLDFHNLYFHVLTEVGVLGATPFFLGLLTCCLSAWKARRNLHVILPLAMLLTQFVVNLGGTTMTDKLFWFTLAYAMASGKYFPFGFQGSKAKPQFRRYVSRGAAEYPFRSKLWNRPSASW
jgi:O-antigen ligase